MLVVTGGPPPNVFGVDQSEPVHVVMLSLQQATRPGAGTLVGIGSGIPAGGGVADGGCAGAIAALPEELEAPDGPSTSGQGTYAVAGTGPPQAYCTPALTTTRCPDVGSAASAPKPPTA